jgi:hypothetical protein
MHKLHCSLLLSVREALASVNHEEGAILHAGCMQNERNPNDWSIAGAPGREAMRSFFHSGACAAGLAEVSAIPWRKKGPQYN